MRTLASLLGLVVAVTALVADDPSPDPATQWAALIGEIVPDGSAARPPYTLARHDLGLDPAQATAIGAPTSGDTAHWRARRLLPGLEALARTRQQRLEREWDALKRGAWRPADTAGLASWALVEYAFGEAPLAPAQTAAGVAGPDSELRLARLLLAECAFEPAVSALVALAGGEGPAADAAFAYLVRHAVERRALARRVTVVGLGLDLDQEIERLGARPAREGLIGALRRQVHASLPGATDTPDDVRVPVEQESVDAADTDFPTDEESPAPMGAELARHVEVRVGSHHTPYLQTLGDELLLFASDEWRQTGQPQAVQLRSRCGGPIALALYRIADESAWIAATPDTLAQSLSVSRFEQELRPLHQNNHAVDRNEVKVELGELEAGYYVVTAVARHSPVMAAVKIAVSRLRLYLRAGSNTAVVVALERGGFRPVPNAAIALEVTGEPDVDRLAAGEDPEHREAWVTGFRDRSSEGLSARLAPAVLLARARDHARGAATRERFPTQHFSLAGRTGADGAIAFPLDLRSLDYSYKLVARSAEGGPATTVIHYQERRAAPQIRALVWCAQPIHRPGETAQVCGIVRRFDAERVLPHDPEQSSVLLELMGREVVWSGKVPLSAVGAFEAEISIPVDAPLGDYQLLVDGRRADPDTPLRIEELRLPSLSVALQLDRRTFAGGEDATGRVQLELASGRPASGMPVELVLETGARRPSMVTVHTDSDGAARFRLPLPQHPYDTTLHLRAMAADDAGRTVNATSPLSVRASSFALEAQVQPNPAPRDGRAAVQVRALAWDGSPLEGVTVVLAGHRSTARTDANGEARVLIDTAHSGEAQTLHLSAVRGEDVVSQIATVRLVAGPKGRPGHADDLSVDMPSVDRGLPLEARLHLDEETGGDSTVLLFIESDRVLDWRVLVLSPGSHALSFPTTPAHAPGAELHAVAINERRLLRDSCRANVRPIERFLALDLETDRSEYKPGEPCRARLVVRDHEGHAVEGAQIALGVVDTSIYQLREDPTPDVREYFWRYRPLHLPLGRLDDAPPGSPSLQWWRGPQWGWGESEGPVADQYHYGQLGGRRLLARGGGGAATYGPNDPPPLRGDFRTTAHWVAHLRSGPDGVATTRFDFPDGITQWRFTARGITADTRVGQLRHHARTLLPVEIDLALPRALREGDRVEAAAMAYDHAGKARHVTITPTGDAPRGALTVELAPNGAARMPLVLHPRGLAPLSLEASALDVATGEGDRVLRTLAVSPRGHDLRWRQAGPIAEGATIALPHDRSAGPLHLVVSLEPSLAAVVDSALDGLIDYPYGCVEQTMSRFLPAVVAAKATARNGGRIAQADRLPAVLAAGLARLTALQHADGSWGWWAHDASNAYLSAYVLEGLVLCRDSGHAVPDRMIDRGAAWLLEQLRTGRVDGGWVGRMGAVDVASQACCALAQVYGADATRYAEERRRVAELIPVRDPGTPSERALLATALRLLGEPDRARALIEAALSAPQPERLDRDATIALARTIEAGAAVLPGDPRWNRLAHTLVLARRGPGWGDTLASAQAIRALCACLEGEGQGEGKGHGEGSLGIEVDGRLVGTLEPAGARNRVLTSEINGARALRLVPTGAGARGWWSVALRGWTRDTPPRPETPSLDVAIRYRRIVGECEPLAADAGTLAVPLAEAIEVTIQIEAHADASHLVLIWPRPCGVELVRPPARDANVIEVEQRDLSLELFLRHLTAGKTTRISFWVRAECAGEVFAPVPRIEAMYGDAPPTAIEAPQLWRIAAR